MNKTYRMESVLKDENLVNTRKKLESMEKGELINLLIELAEGVLDNMKTSETMSDMANTDFTWRIFADVVED